MSFDTFDTRGTHNANLEAATSRILSGGTWKKQDMVMLLPAAKMVPTKCVMSWMALLFPPNQAVHRVAMLGLEVGDAYSIAIDKVLATPHMATAKYILTVEHDNSPPPDGALRLVAHMDAHPEFDCISGLYWTKGEGGVPQIWGDPKDGINFRPQPPDPKGGLVECNGTGMGFALWRMDLFKDQRIKRPLFRTISNGHEGTGTQDLAFWAEAKKYGHRCAVACDVLVGHYDQSTDTNW